MVCCYVDVCGEICRAHRTHHVDSVISVCSSSSDRIVECFFVGDASCRWRPIFKSRESTASRAVSGTPLAFAVPQRIDALVRTTDALLIYVDIVQQWMVAGMSE